MDKSDFIGRSPPNFERPKYQNFSTVTFISCSLEIHFVHKIQSNIECKYTKNFVVCFELEQKLFSYYKLSNVRDFLQISELYFCKGISKNFNNLTKEDTLTD